MKKHIVIAGAGISGLSAAFYVHRQLSECGLDAKITIVDKEQQPGGKIQTLHKPSFVIERGPDSFLARKQPVIDLTRELELTDELVGTNPNVKQAYIVRHGKLYAMPQGFVLGIPTKVFPFLRTGLITPWGKLRASLDFIVPRRKQSGDESLAGFLERRMGKEVHRHVAEPLLSGIYAGDTKQLSVQATFPQFHQLEQKHRSLIRGMVASRKTSAPTANLPKHVKRSMFLTFRGGLSTLVEKLMAHVQRIADVKLGNGIAHVHKKEHSYELTLTNGETIVANRIILALPAYVTAELVHELPAVKELASIEYASVANVVMAFDEAAVTKPLDGSGFVVPSSEGRFITACTWTSTKWLHTAPQGKVLLRCYVGRAGNDAWRDLTDEQIVQKVRQDLLELIRLQAEPEWVEVTRWEKAMPQYRVNHLDKVHRAEAQLSEQWPGVVLAGAAYYGVGIPDCIRQGKEAAMKIVQDDMDCSHFSKK